MDHLKEPLDEEVATIPKTRIIRLKVQQSTRVLPIIQLTELPKAKHQGYDFGGRGKLCFSAE